MANMKAADYRQIARKNLEGKWGVAVVTTMLAGIMGASNNSSASSITYNFNSIFQDFNLEGTEGLDAEVNTLIDEILSSPGLLATISFILIIVAIWSFAIFVIAGPTRLGLCQFNKNLYYNEDPKFSDLFSHFNNFKKGFLTLLLMNIFTFLWTLLLIIPGIIKSFAYSMSFYILMEDPSLEPKEAIKRSEELMKGQKLNLFFLFISFIGWQILSLLTLGIGYFFLSPYMEQATYAFYKNISTPDIIEPDQSDFTNDMDTEIVDIEDTEIVDINSSTDEWP
ncbi:MAG: DUF975 family protein [Ruminococcaceae bacterium]|nr:DUF975 family protein [Oscillospiraceae bacterium]